MMSEIGSDYPDLLTKTGIGAFPNASNADGRTATTLGNFKWVIDAKSKHADAAGKFLEWSLAGDPQNLVPFFVNTQFTKVPVRKSVQEAVAKDEAAAKAPWSSVITNDIAPDAIPEPTYPWDVRAAVGNRDGVGHEAGVGFAGRRHQDRGRRDPEGDPVAGSAEQGSEEVSAARSVDRCTSPTAQPGPAPSPDGEHR